MDFKLSSQEQATHKNQLIKKLIKQQHIASQKSLCLNNCHSDWSSVLQYQDWSFLAELSLCNCKIVGFKLSQLLLYKFQNLTKLQLFKNNIGSLGTKVLSKIYLPCLQELNLSTCNIGDEGCKNLSKSKWANIQKLQICQNNIKDNGCQELQNRDWKNLKFLRLNLVYMRLTNTDQISMMCLIRMDSRRCRVQANIKNSFLNFKINNILRERFMPAYND